MEATIYLQPSDNSLKIAKFVKNNIDNIRRAGVRVRMEKVPKDTSSYTFKKLEERGINRLPALVSGEVTRVGYDSIVDWFTAMRPAAPAAAMRPTRTDASIESFMRSAVSGDDQDVEEDIGGDMARKAAQMAKMRQDATPRPRAPQAREQPQPPPRAQQDENVRRVPPAEDFDAQDQEDMINAYMQQEIQ